MPASRGRRLVPQATAHRSSRAALAVVVAARRLRHCGSSSTSSSPGAATSSSLERVGLGRVADARHQELHRGIHRRCSSTSRPSGQGLQDQLQGEHRRHRGRRQGADQWPDRCLSRVHRRVGGHGRGDQQDGHEPAAGVQPRQAVLRQARPGDEPDDAVLRHRRDRGEEGLRHQVRPRHHRRPEEGPALHARRPARVPEPPGGRRGHEERLRGQELLVQVARAGPPVPGAGQRLGRRHRRVHHRPAAGQRQVRRAQGPEEHLRLPEHRAGHQQEQARRSRPA